MQGTSCTLFRPSRFCVCDTDGYLDSFFLLIVFSMTITMKAFFRTLAAAFGSAAPAQTFAGLSVLLLVLYTGYTIPQPSMIGALRWITYINVRSAFVGSLRRYLPLRPAAQIRFRGPCGE